MNKYLLEIGVEELPSRFVEDTMKQLQTNVETLLSEHSISYESIEVYATPRRIALFVNNIERQQGDINLEVKGPSKKIAFDENGNPTKPLLGFMKSQNISLEDLETKEIKGTEYVYGNVHKKGENIENIIEKNMPQCIRNITFGKSMKWGGKNLKFARPIRWLVSMIDNEILPINLEGIVASNITRGHRFLGSSNIVIDSVENYEKLLEENFVILNQSKRRELIKYGSKKLAKTFGGEIKRDPELLEELTYIVEYPTPILGKIKEEYLGLPSDVITTPMKEHLRYTPIYGSKGNLLPYFITIRNGNDDYTDIVVEGNEKVLGARLEDAKFFYEEDLSSPLENNVERLSGIVFQENLGTMHEKTLRLQELSKKIGEYLEVADETLNSLDRAAYLSKADLLTNMVQEFTELQGKIGAVYSEKFNESEIVCNAIEEQYMPRFAGDKLPASTTGSILAIADKLDTIVGLFAIDLTPTGSQDPFALRRCAIGVINIINNNKWDVSLGELIDYSLYVYVEEKGLAFDYNKVKTSILNFFYTRIKNMLSQQNISYDVIDSVLSCNDDKVLNIFTKAGILNKWFRENEHTKFVETFTRLENIIIKKDTKVKFQESLLQLPQEVQLYEAYTSIKNNLEQLICEKKYYESMNLLTSLVEPINNYFDNVMVIVDELDIKNNRLEMLSNISKKVKEILNIKSIVE